MTDGNKAQKTLSQSSILVISAEQGHCQALRAFMDALAIEEQAFIPPSDQAIAKALRERPSLILLDCDEGGDSAIGLLEPLCQSRALRNTPVLAAVPDHQPQNRDYAFSMGATDVVSLPFRGAEVINRLRVYLERNLYKDEARRYQDGYEEGAALARQLQESLLPTPISIKDIEQAYGLELDFYFEASHMVGGDLWGFHRLNASKLGIFCIDFSGHGVSAALNCFRFHTTMTEIPPSLDDPASYLASLNRSLRPAIRRGQFATMFYGILDVAKQCLVYSAAGTPGPIVGNPQFRESFRILDTSGVPLGITDDAVYRNITVPLEPDSFILLFSDALIEATQIIEGSSLGEDGIAGLLCESIENFEGVPPLDGLIGRFFERISWAELPDDLTAVWVHLPQKPRMQDEKATIAGVPR